jgi:2-dehydro-3-deoxyphosphogluconate aldolase / (4S)-4-hydroxy-2-oxoglutarate aldolase
MTKAEVIDQIHALGIVPCARVQVAEHAEFAAETLWAAGIPVLEIPLTLPEAPRVIEGLVKRFPDLAAGGGTVLDLHSAHRLVDAGARFITSPGYIPEVVEFCNRADIVVFPGALTPSEVIAAWKGGADFVKIFPASIVGGSDYIRALKVPLRQIPLIVTGGVSQMTAFDYILAGASAIGVGAELLPRESLLHRQNYRIHELARRFLQMVVEARAQRDSA